MSARATCAAIPWGEVCLPAAVGLPGGPAGALLGEQPGRIAEGLELQGVAGGVVEEHRRLLADLPGKAYPRGDLEALAFRREPLGQALPAIPAQHDPEMRYRHLMAVHGVAQLRCAAAACRIQVRYQLVAEEVKVHPVG